MTVTETISTITTNTRPHQQTLITLLQSSNSINKLTQIHTQILINGFTHKRSLITTLLSLYVTYGHFNYARHLFDKMPDRNTAAYNQIIRGFSRNGHPFKSIGLFSEMVDEGLDPDEYTYCSVISVCARLSMLREGEQLHGRVLSSGYCSNVFIGTNLVNLYCSVGSDVGFGNARKVFDEMPVRNLETWNSFLGGCFRCRRDVGFARRVFDEMLEKSVVTWTTMIVGCTRNGMFREGLSLFREMKRGGAELDQALLVAALSACAELGDLSLGRWIHSYVNKSFHGRNKEICVRLSNALVHMYASCGEIDEAYKVFSGMPKRTVVSWTSMIVGFAKHGNVEKALEVFEWMEKSSLRPDSVTFIGVLSACRHAGYVKEGYRYFKEMKEKWDIDPSIEHYGCMVDLLSRAGFLQEAQRLIADMPMKPNHVIWGALLNGSLVHRNLELASYATLNLLMGLDQDQVIDYVVPLSNAYLMQKRWKEFAELRRKIIESGSEHPKGQSWVQVNGRIHGFVAHDFAHKHGPSNYRMLDSLTQEVRFEAHYYDMKEEFIDVY